MKILWKVALLIFFFFETNINWEFFHQHSRQSTINPAAINHHHVQGHPAKTNSILFFFFFFQFQQRNHTRYCIGKCLYINIRSDLHWKNSTQTKKKSKYITKIISDINKKNRCYRRSFFSNHFLRAVTSMAMNILAFLSSSKSSQTSKKDLIIHVRNGLKCCNYTFYWAVVFVFLKYPNDISFKCHF